MKLTLNKTWTECLRMWKWIAENDPPAGDSTGMDVLKSRWLSEHGYTPNLVFLRCFFCDYANEKREISGCVPTNLCQFCPGRQVSKTFQCEVYRSYNWMLQPRNFYKKILKLHKRYLKTKKKK